MVIPKILKMRGEGGYRAKHLDIQARAANRSHLRKIYFDEEFIGRWQSHCLAVLNREVVEGLRCRKRGCPIRRGFRRMRITTVDGNYSSVVTHSVFKFGGCIRVCITTQYCSVFSRKPRSCSSVALGAAILKRR
jgi:hypothetical protein